MNKLAFVFTVAAWSTAFGTGCSAQAGGTEPGGSGSGSGSAAGSGTGSGSAAGSGTGSGDSQSGGCVDSPHACVYCDGTCTPATCDDAGDECSCSPQVVRPCPGEDAG